MNKRLIDQINQDRELGGLSFRSLATKYGIPLSTVHKMANSKSDKKAVTETSDRAASDELSVLKAQLRQEQLRNELLNNMIDIASKELGIDIRKKSGTKRSE